MDKDLNKENFLYYYDMGGAGTFHCNECGHEEEIVSFLHVGRWNNTGFQCQDCGKFHEIEYDMDNLKEKKCECGGVLDKEKPLFCPKCKTKNVSYRMNYIA
jgi:DNA-directed RNA polymerase subunit M/transcription elongation factor TFIIS